ncbi:hypothetical protein EGW08_022515 [Elysia chlorotica]|uniref:Uncharacterized protein n=1 Tax=Elysia chlorotica TaxID=188477 RepID=A0A433SKR6_ELYCH|nr:hypothetical protein EGW08_022515 [Elysia chlorotica]
MHSCKVQTLLKTLNVNAPAFVPSANFRLRALNKDAPAFVPSANFRLPALNKDAPAFVPGTSPRLLNVDAPAFVPSATPRVPALSVYIPSANPAAGKCERYGPRPYNVQWNPLVNTLSRHPYYFLRMDLGPKIPLPNIPNINMRPRILLTYYPSINLVPSNPPSNFLRINPRPWVPATPNQMLVPGPFVPATPNQMLVPGPFVPATPNQMLVPGPWVPATPNQMVVPGPWVPATPNQMVVPGPWVPATPNQMVVPGPCNPVVPNQMLFSGPYNAGLTNFWVKPEPMSLFQQSTSLAATEINPQAQIQAQQDFGMDGRGDGQVPNEQMLETIAEELEQLDVPAQISDKIETQQGREEVIGHAANHDPSGGAFLSESQDLNVHGVHPCYPDCKTCASFQVNLDPLGCKDKWDQMVNKEIAQLGQYI